MASPGIIELGTLIKSMSPSLHSTTYVFATIPQSHQFLQLAPVESEMIFRESEGWTVILAKERAEYFGMDVIFPCKKITLNVLSSLDAVGFLAAITSRLAEKLSIGINPVSGYYHDHLFVPLGKEELVVGELKAMAAEQK